jgi:hypothetical protein
MGTLLFLFLVAASAALALYRWTRQVRRSNAQSWESLVARLQPARNGRPLSEYATPEERWRQVGGAQGLWAMHQNAMVMLEMADYAACHGESIDRDLLARLRSDALQIRLLVIRSLMEYSVHTLNEGISINVLRAATLYREMSARVGELLDVNGELALQKVCAR